MQECQPNFLVLSYAHIFKHVIAGRHYKIATGFFSRSPR